MTELTLTSELRPSPLAEAFAKAQANFSNPKFNRKNPHYGSDYADIAECLAAVRPALSAQSISFNQDAHPVEGGVHIFTILTHSSGERWRFGPYFSAYEKRGAHGQASAATYGCRKHLCIVCGVSGEQDDDGNAAVKGRRSASEAADGPNVGDRKLPPSEEVEAALSALKSVDNKDDFKAAWLALSQELRQAIGKALGKEKFAELIDGLKSVTD